MYDPYGTTEKGAGYYQLHPIPTPPPPPEWKPRTSRKPWLYTALFSFIATLIVLFAAIEGITYWTSHQQEIAPTPDVDLQMNTGEFDAFIRAFAQAMADKKYDAIKDHTDTNNFQGIMLYSDGGYATWQNTYDRLTTGNISFVVQYPVITAQQANYSCFGYTQKGVAGLINIDARAVQYVVGSTNQPTSPDNKTTQSDPDGTVFIFEQPNGPGNYWFWRGYTLNNIAGCNA